jgi:hypothetical protein
MKLSPKVWNPTLVAGNNLELWLAYNTGITVSGGLVSQWRTNVSGSNKNFAQSTTNYKPSFSEADATEHGVIFDGTDNYMGGDQFTLTDEFVVGIKFTITDSSVTNDVVTGDMDAANNFIRINDTNTIGVKTSGSQKSIDMDEATVFEDDTTHNMVVGRDESNNIRIWLDGLKQTDTAVSEGDFLIDGLGARNSGGGVTNFFTGVVYEFIIVNKVYSDELAKNVSLHLKSVNIG